MFLGPDSDEQPRPSLTTIVEAAQLEHSRNVLRLNCQIVRYMNRSFNNVVLYILYGNTL